jgi:hypothetical protein
MICPLYGTYFSSLALRIILPRQELESRDIALLIFVTSSTVEAYGESCSWLRDNDVDCFGGF